MRSTSTWPAMSAGRASCAPSDSARRTVTLAMRSPGWTTAWPMIEAVLSTSNPCSRGNSPGECALVTRLISFLLIAVSPQSCSGTVSATLVEVLEELLESGTFVSRRSLRHRPGKLRLGRTPLATTLVVLGADGHLHGPLIARGERTVL